MARLPRQKLIDLFDLRDDFVIVDAKKPIAILPTKVDADGAVVLDPAHCVYARACERQLHKPAVFLKTMAYVRQSRNRVVKYEIPPLAQAHIKTFDATGKAPYGDIIYLNPPRDHGPTHASNNPSGPDRYRPTKAQRAKDRATREKMHGKARHL